VITTYKFIYDPGHGWLEVPMAEVMKLGVKPSGYSYINPVTKLAYLEEDCDAPDFSLAWERHYGKAFDKTVYTPEYQEVTFVRDLPSINDVTCRPDGAVIIRV
jgi:hypothetical protein